MSILRWDRFSVKLGVAVLAVLAVLAWHIGPLGAQAPAGRGAAPAAPAQGGRGGGRAAAPISGDPILVGAIDLHAHQGPDNRARSLDFLDAARYA